MNLESMMCLDFYLLSEYLAIVHGLSGFKYSKGFHKYLLGRLFNFGSLSSVAQRLHIQVVVLYCIALIALYFNIHEIIATFYFLCT